MKYQNILFFWAISLLFACNTQVENPVVSPSDDESSVVEEPPVVTLPDTPPPVVEEEPSVPVEEPPTPPTPEPVSPPSGNEASSENYAWTSSYDAASALYLRFNPPPGYKRMEYPAGSYADWLRNLPLKPKGSSVAYYNGGIKPNPVHEAVLDVDVGTRDLQQCADAVMRLQAEYHYQKKDYKNIHFNFTSGHKVSFDDWRKGKKPRVSGNSVTFSSPSGGTDNSYRNFKKYMNMIFNYAGTASLTKELKRVSVADIRPGDVFIQGGFPGHAILVADVAENASGERVFMLAQSYMPAQDIHVLKNYGNPSMSPWYGTDFGSTLSTPEWTFQREDLKRFR